MPSDLREVAKAARYRWRAASRRVFVVRMTGAYGMTGAQLEAAVEQTIAEMPERADLDVEGLLQDSTRFYEKQLANGVDQEFMYVLKAVYDAECNNRAEKRRCPNCLSKTAFYRLTSEKEYSILYHFRCRSCGCLFNDAKNWTTPEEKEEMQ